LTLRVAIWYNERLMFRLIARRPPLGPVPFAPGSLRID
jgi:hypothetical protein